MIGRKKKKWIRVDGIIAVRCPKCGHLYHYMMPFCPWCNPRIFSEYLLSSCEDNWYENVRG